MASIRKAIADAAEAALDGGSKPTGLNVHRLRTRPIEQDNLPATLLYFENEAVEYEEGDLDGSDGEDGRSVERVLLLRLEHRAQVPADTDPDTALDPYYVWGVQALLQDSTLAALITDIREAGTAWDLTERDVNLAACATTFAVYYQTADDDPEESRV